MNKQRGEVEVKGASGSTYIFKLGTGAICALEQKLEKPVLELFEQLKQGKIRLTTVREFVKASHVPEELDDAGANELIDDVGVMPVLDAMTDSMILTFNSKSEPENPQKPAARGKRNGAGISKTPPK